MATPHPRPIMIVLALSFVLLAGSCREPSQAGQLKLYDLQTRRPITGAQAVDALKSARLVIVGEHHADQSHHKAQLLVIRTMNAQSIPLSIGLEMFRKDQQGALTRWLSGDIDEKAFEKIYLDNWNFPWSLYRDIFITARERNIPLVGLKTFLNRLLHQPCIDKQVACNAGRIPQQNDGRPFQVSAKRVRSPGRAH